MNAVVAWTGNNPQARPVRSRLALKIIKRLLPRLG
jgi:hypothetical protein